MTEMNAKRPPPPKWDRKRLTRRITPRQKQRIQDIYDALMTKGKDRDAILGRLAKTYNRSTRQIERYIAEVAHGGPTSVFGSLIQGSALEGRAVLLDKSLMSRQANESEILDFYSGGPLSWKIISVHADVSRDQEKEVLEQLEQSQQGFRILCIVAEFGAGKSTAAWRAAYELYSRQKKTVIHLLDNSESEFWYRLPSLIRKLGDPIYILVDDIFRYEDAVQAIRNLDSQLQATVIATSRSNEYKGQRRLGKRIERIELNPLSAREKELFLAVLNKPYETLSSEEQHRVDDSDSFLTLGMELTRGQDFHEIIRDAVNWLDRNDPTLYRAYEYVCFCHQYGISIPAGLLYRMDAEGHFHNIVARETATGMLYEDELRPGYIRTKQECIAQTALSFYSRNPRSVLREIMGGIDVSDRPERLFLARISRIMAEKEPAIIRETLVSNKPRIEEVTAHASILELGLWTSTYQKLELKDRADEVADLILSIDPRDGREAGKQAQVHIKRGQFDLALGMLQSRLPLYGNDVIMRSMYLSLIKKQGTPEQVQGALVEASQWLGTHPGDTFVRQSYLSLMEARGTHEQTRQALIETETWLDDHPGNAALWTQYAVLAGTGKSRGEADLALEKMRAWLLSHPRHSSVYRAYLSLVRKTGDSDQVEQALIDAQETFDDYGVESSTFLAYLKLVDTRGTECQVDTDRVKRLGYQFRARYPKDTMGIEYFASWLRSQKFYEDATRLYEEHLLKKAPSNFNIRYGYGRLLLELKQYNEAASEFWEALRLHQGHVAAHGGLAHALGELGKDKEAEREFRQAIYWAKINKGTQAGFYHGLGLFYLSRSRNLEARDCFRCAIAEDPNNFGHWWRFGCALLALDSPDEALEAFKTAQKKAAGHLQPPASEELPSQIAACESRIQNKANSET